MQYSEEEKAMWLEDWRQSGPEMLIEKGEVKTYYGISLNFLCIAEFYELVKTVWLKWLNRRGNKGKRNWNSFLGLLERLAATETANNALLLLSETLTRGTGCLNWARPGLRGLRVGNCPVLLGNFIAYRI